jgi:hypothetical protein
MKARPYPNTLSPGELAVQIQEFEDSQLWREIVSELEKPLGPITRVLEDRNRSIEEIRFAQGELYRAKRAILVLEDIKKRSSRYESLPQER